jgi:hypothetical protein
MKRILKFLLGSLRTFFWFIGDLVYAAFYFQTILSGSIKYEARKRNLLILGNGPSLKNDMSNIRAMNNDNLDFMCCNSFCLSDDFTLIKPKYYVMADPGYWVNDADPVSVAQRIATFERFFLVDWEMQLIVPASAKKFDLNAMINNHMVDVVYVNSLPMRFKIDGLSFISYKMNLFSPSFLNVLIMCIFVGINMGYKVLFVYGADHSWHESICVKNDNHIYIVEKHCYDDEPVKEHRMEWVNSKPITMGEVFTGWGTVFNSYYELDKYAKTRNTVVVNNSSKSYIDAFVRKLD